MFMLSFAVFVPHANLLCRGKHPTLRIFCQMFISRLVLVAWGIFHGLYNHNILLGSYVVSKPDQ